MKEGAVSKACSGTGEAGAGVVPVRERGPAGISRRGLAIMLTIFLAGAAAPAPAAGSEQPGGWFWDDDGNVHEGWIEAVADAGVTRGCGGALGDLYCPDRLITRGEMAAMLARALRLPPGGSDWFSDDDRSPFEGEINALAAAGITRGCRPGAFCPEDALSRSQMAGFLTRALSLPAGVDRFRDDDGWFFEPAIDALAAAGITVGCNPPASDRFCPGAPVRRDQMAAFLGRGFELTETIPNPRPAVTAAFTGDLLLHMPVNTAARGYGSGSTYNFQPMFAPVRELLAAADLAICHLEVTLSPTSSGLTGYPRFRGPAEVATDVAHTGYDGCSTASNHAYDYGTRGVLDTLAVLDAAGLERTGTASSAADRDEPTVYTVEGASIAHLSYTYSLNGFALPPDQPWLANLIDRDTILADAAAARAGGADIVIVSLHWGAEYQPSPTSQQTSLGRGLIASDHIDLVVGHHAHVVQPIEKVGEEYIVYGLGNFLSNQRSRVATQDGMIVTAEFVPRGERWVTRAVTYTPTWVEGGTYRILPAAETLAAGASGSLAAALDASWRRTHAVVQWLPNDAAPTATP